MFFPAGFSPRFLSFLPTQPISNNWERRLELPPLNE